jgi:hypothetical protein
MQIFEEFPPRQKTAAEAVTKGLAINHPLLQEPRPLNQGCGSSFSKAAKKVQEEKAGSFALLFSE